MEHRPPQPSRAVREAAIWSAKLSRTSITNEEIRRFSVWYNEPENYEAFKKLLRR